MDEKYVNRFLRREFRVVGWLLAAYYGIMNILTVAAVFSDVLRQFLQSLSRGQFPGNPDIHALMGNGWGYVATVAVGLLFLFCWKEDRFWKESVLASHGRMTVGVFAVLACLCMAAQLVNSLWIAGLELVMNQFDRSVMDILESVSGQSDTFSMFLYASILAPVSEELIFRGYILQTLRPYGKKFAIVLSAFLFGIFHGNLLQTPYAFLMGLVLGYVTVEYHIGWAVEPDSPQSSRGTSPADRGAFRAGFGGGEPGTAGRCGDCCRGGSDCQAQKNRGVHSVGLDGPAVREVLLHQFRSHRADGAHGSERADCDGIVTSA